MDLVGLLNCGFGLLSDTGSTSQPLQGSTRCSLKQLVGTVHVWTVTTANTMAAKFTWVTSGPTSTSIITTGTSTSTVRYTTANP